MSRHLMRISGLAAIGVLALSGCGGAGGGGAAAEKTEAKPICEQEASEATTIDSAPEVEWVDEEDRVAYPKSDDLGPAKEKDGIGTCYRHSPEGALVAATDYLATFLSLDTDRTRKLVDVQGTGEDKDEIVDAFRKAEEDASSDGDVQEALKNLKVAGYQLEDYTKDKAEISLAYDVESYGHHVQMPVTFEVTWTDGDWKFSNDGADGGDFDRDLSGFTPWGPAADVLEMNDSASASPSS